MFDTLNSLSNLVYQNIFLIDAHAFEVIWSSSQKGYLYAYNVGDILERGPGCIIKMFFGKICAKDSCYSKFYEKALSMISQLPEAAMSSLCIVMEFCLDTDKRRPVFLIKLTPNEYTGNVINSYLGAISYAPHPEPMPPSIIYEQENKKLWWNWDRGKLTKRTFRRLSSRQRDVLSCAIQGMSEAQTAEVLNLSVYTIKLTRKSIREKVEAPSFAAAVNIISNYNLI